MLVNLKPYYIARDMLLCLNYKSTIADASNSQTCTILYDMFCELTDAICDPYQCVFRLWHYIMASLLHSMTRVLITG